MTVQEMFRLVKSRAGESGTAFSTTQILDEINASKNYVWAELEKKDPALSMSTTTIAVVSGTREYSRPSADRTVDHIDRTDLDEVLPCVLIDDWRDRDHFRSQWPTLSPSTVSTRYGAPVLYVRGRNIGFVQKPSQSMTLTEYYYKIPLDATTGNATGAPVRDWTTDVPVEFHDLIVNQAVVNVLGGEDAIGVAPWIGQVTKGLNQLQNWRGHEFVSPQRVRFSGI